MFDWNQVSSAVSVLLVQWFEPFNVVLFTSILLFAILLWRTQKRSDFDLVDTIRGDTDGKASLARIAYMGAFITSTWVLMSYSANKGGDPRTLVELFIGYVIVWALPKVAEKWIDSKYNKERQ